MIALIDGYCFGVGLELPCRPTSALATERSEFALPEIGWA